MTRDNTVAAHIGAQLMAMDLAHGRALMSVDLTAAAARGAPAFQAIADLRIEPGERFAVLRGVAVMPIRGILTPDSEMLERYLGWATYRGIETAADQLAADADVTAVVLDVNSPGGSVLSCEAAVGAIARLAAVKPVYTLVNPMACSAAYWIAAGAASVTMTPGALVGSIGVMAEASAPVQPDMMGEQTVIIRSSHARAKNPDPTTEAGLAAIQSQVDESEWRFLEGVATARGIDVAELPALLSITDDPADGGSHFYFEAALSRRLADGQETRAAFYDRVFAQYGLQPRKASGSNARSGYAAQAVAAQARAAI